MKKILVGLVAVVFASSSGAQEAPTDNRYDVVGKIFQPFWSVLLAGGEGRDKAASLQIVMREVTGRLPKEFEGGTLDAAIQFPDKVKLIAPVLGERMTVCRSGDKVWAVPGAKIEYLLKQFAGKLPPPTEKANTPLFLPITAQQAVFLPALFVMEEEKIFEELNGEQTRVLSGGLMPELAKAAKAEDFRASVWVASGYLPRQIKVVQKDFTATVGIENLVFAPALAPSVWAPPEGETDVYWTTPDVLEQLLFVLMNSVQSKEGEEPWMKVR
ncbi:MAG: hypothetical protein WA771_04510 [Chthoniobacterales bacterium]